MAKAFMMICAVLLLSCGFTLAQVPASDVILAGTNELAGNTGPTTLDAVTDNLSSMADLATAHGIRVVLAAGRCRRHDDRAPRRRDTRTHRQLRAHLHCRVRLPCGITSLSFIVT